MKTKLLTLVLATGLLAIIGAAFFQTMAQIPALPINVVFDPKGYTWNGLPPSPWYAEIWRQKVQDKADYSSIKLEGIYLPSATPYPALHGPRLIIPFNGEDIRVALYPKLPTHMGILVPGTYKVSLIVSGALKPEFGGTPFEGDGIITVTILPPPP